MGGQRLAGRTVETNRVRAMPLDLDSKVVRSQSNTVTTLEVRIPAVGGHRRQRLGGHGERGGRGSVYGGEERKKSWENNKTLVDQAHGRSSEANPQRWMISNGGWKDHEV